MSIHTHKMVNGTKVRLTAKEIAHYDARDAAWLAEEPAREQQRQRDASLRTDPVVADLGIRLATATAGQIDAWITSTPLADVLKAVIKTLAARTPSQS